MRVNPETSHQRIIHINIYTYIMYSLKMHKLLHWYTKTRALSWTCTVNNKVLFKIYVSNCISNRFKDKSGISGIVKRLKAEMNVSSNNLSNLEVNTSLKRTKVCLKNKVCSVVFSEFFFNFVKWLFFSILYKKDNYV